MRKYTYHKYCVSTYGCCCGIKRNVSRLCKHKTRDTRLRGFNVRRFLYYFSSFIILYFFSSLFWNQWYLCMYIYPYILCSPIDSHQFKPINCICFAGIKALVYGYRGRGGFEDVSRNCQKRPRQFSVNIYLHLSPSPPPMIPKSIVRIAIQILSIHKHVKHVRKQTFVQSQSLLFYFIIFFFCIYRPVLVS